MKIQFPYPGGKAKIREKLFPYFPEEGLHYLEPFVGRGNIFFEFYKRSAFEDYTINDLKLGRFFKALRDVNLDDLPLEVLPEMFDVWVNRWLAGDNIAYILEPKISFRGKGYDAGYQKGRYNPTNYKPLCLAAQSILKDPKITIHQMDYIHLPWSALTEDDFVYCDPPYFDTRGMGYNNINHIELMKKLTDGKFRWAVSGYLSDLYLSWLGEPALKLTRNIEMTDSRGSTAVECLWTNE
jgi:site-specific DNA-adenine methylase